MVVDVERVSLETPLDGVDTSAEYVLAFCDGGYTSNLSLADVRDGKAWIAYEYEDGRSARSTAGRRGYSSPAGRTGVGATSDEVRFVVG